MNLFERFESVASGQPDQLALRIKEGAEYRCLTYGEVARQARAVSWALVQAGLAPGDRVALISENRPEWAVAYFGLTAAGGVAVPLDVQLSDAEVTALRNHLQAGGFLFINNCSGYGDACNACLGVRIASIGRHLGQGPGGRPANRSVA